MTITQAVITVATAGTPERLTTDVKIRASAIFVQALHSNTQKAYVGVSGLTKATGAGVIVTLDAKQSWAFDTGDGSDRIQVSDYYFDADVNGEKLLVTYFVG